MSIIYFNILISDLGKSYLLFIDYSLFLIICFYCVYLADVPIGTVPPSPTRALTPPNVSTPSKENKFLAVSAGGQTPKGHRRTISSPGKVVVLETKKQPSFEEGLGKKSPMAQSCKDFGTTGLLAERRSGGDMIEREAEVTEEETEGEDDINIEDFEEMQIPEPVHETIDSLASLLILRFIF